jgi:hypothetical protein
LTRSAEASAQKKSMYIDPDKLRESAVSGIQRGLRSFLWVMKILLPVSLLTAALEWSGWLYRVDYPFEFLMNWIGLPGTAAVPLLVAMITGIYGGIAAMSVLPFTPEQMTLMAIFMMICHSLIQEGIIQGKSGLNPVKAGLFRLAAAVITVWAVSLFFDTPAVAFPATVSSPGPPPPLGSLLYSWSFSTLALSLKIFAIIVGLQIVLEIFRDMGWLHPVIRSLSPVLKILGLNRRAGIPWMTGVVFGLIYGSAIIVEEIQEGILTREEVEKLHLFIGINHSFIEDPIVFMALGLSFFWLWVPRILAAVISVHLLHLWQHRRQRGFV